IALLWQDVENPYKGLRAFERGESQDFFGREEFVQRLVWRMQEADPYQRFLAVVGPSGSGKSSVARAGLLPALVKNAIAGSDHWFSIDMIPGDSPFDALETALTRIAADQAMNLREHLNRDERGLVRAADLILPKDKSQLLLLIDQFEEVFTLVTNEDQRRRFLDLLLATVTAPHSRVRIVATLRADFYDRPLQYPKFGEMLRARMETILPLTAQGIERAIVGPVERLGMVFEEGLVAQIVSETTYQAGALPLLQFALTALFDLRDGHKLTHEAYQQIGGVGGALANRIEDIYRQLDPEAQEAVRQLFLRLVTLGEGVEDTRRRVPRSELVAVSNDADLMEDLIDFLAQERFLALDNDPATRAPMVEVAHEAILREWERLRAWINDSRAELRMHRELARLAEDWQKADQESSYLLRGARLNQFETWARATNLSLTPAERNFLEVSQQVRDANLAEEQLRQQHEVTLEERAKRVLQILSVVLLLAAIGGLALAAFALDREQRAQQALLSVEAAEAEARELALINGASAAYQGGDIQTGVALAVAANSVENPPALARATLSEIAYHSGPMRRLGDEFDFALSLDISSDGKYLLADRHDFAVVLWDLETGQPIHEMTGHEAMVLTVDISPDGRMGASIATDRTIILWDLETGRMLRRFGSDHILSMAALSVTFSPDGKTLLSNNGGLPMLDPELEAKLILWDVETGTPIREYTGHNRVVGRPAFSPDGSMILSGGENEEFILWDVETGEIIRRREEYSSLNDRVPTDIVFRPDGRTALVLFWDTTAILLDINTLETLQTYGTGSTGAASWSQLPVSPDGQTLYLSNPERTGQAFWDVESGEMLESLTETGARMSYGAAFTPDGSALVVSQDGIGVVVYAVHHGAEVQSFAFQPNLPPQEFIISPDGRLMVVRVFDGQQCEVIIYDLVSNAEINRFDYESDLIEQLGCDTRQYSVFHPNGQSILARSADGQGILWNAHTGAILSRI
ncbi:MAG: WD40 repeat domain-containing protein, partial [Anaerolineae bacterium]|nr:WD40 repeat domain-containing protein [Anaerolineae bacterium]